ncbi:hypothetical protein HMPREF1141_1067 [Clostridium sp. MSTE9]|nr:hypothetical protein HMPREF1141_1067 [Clostridium sp. MSTE9]
MIRGGDIARVDRANRRAGVVEKCFQKKESQYFSGGSVWCVDEISRGSIPTVEAEKLQRKKEGTL